MIVETRYRDIPYEEARKCYQGGVVPKGGGDGKRPWKVLRGQPVSIIVPATNSHRPEIVCGGPFFLLADDDRYVVCPHIAEIGD